MPTFSDLIADAESRLASAKRAADNAREAAADAKDRAERSAATARGLTGPELAQRDERTAQLASTARQLASTAKDATDVHRDAGRALAALRIEAEIEDWVTRYCRDSVHLVGDPAPVLAWVDPALDALAMGDTYASACLHLQRAGVAIPAHWLTQIGVLA